MKHHGIFRSIWVMPAALLIISAIVGCQPAVPTQPPASPVSASSPTPPPAATTESASPTPGVQATAASTSKDVLFQDDFTNPASGWDDAKLGDYFVGYHGPDWYHIEIDGSNEKVAISEPKKTSYKDITVELLAFAVAAKTAPTGDFRFGLSFRRSGGQYYAFTISPMTKKWAMLKVSSDKVEILKEGSDDSIHGLDGKDLLRVDAMGSSFLLYINDHPAGQVTDASYPSGEVGLYAETLDNPKVHIHNDTFTVRDLQLDLACTINGGTFNVRTGPGKSFPQVAVLSAGVPLEPMGVSPNREWIQIKLKDNNDLGWVSFSEGFMSCTPSLELFPVVNP
jgi:Bacterial SH3 domain